MEKRNKICGIATLPGTVKSFMLGNLNYMADNGYDAYCVCNPTLSADELGKVRIIESNIKWGFVSPFEFFRQIRWFYTLFKKEHFDIVQYATFNAAFPASIAAWMARVPVRIDLQWGMSYITAKGVEHYFKRAVEKITCWCSTSVQPDSFGNLKLATEDGLYPASKGCVIYNGSASGVDLEKYNYNKRAEWRKELFNKYAIQNYKKYFGYVGRVVKDKGIDELLEAFMSLKNNNAFLWIVGPLDATYSLNQELYEKAKQMKNICFTGSVDNAAKYYAAMDFMLLPSYHEGFGMTVVESAGVGTPAIITDIPGPTDLIKDGINGIVCEVKSVDSLRNALLKAVEMSDVEYKTMSDKAYNIAKTNFDSNTYKVKFFENREMLFTKALAKR